MAEMHWHPARVCRSDTQSLTLMFERPEHCQRCQAGQGCGAGLWARLFVSTQPTTMTVPRQHLHGHQDAQQTFVDGDWVRVGVPSTVLARAAFSVYGWPLLVFVATLLVAPRDWPEVGVLALAVLAAMAAVIFSRRRRSGAWMMRIEGLKASPTKPTS